MNQKELQDVVLRVVLTEIARTGEYFVPVTSSNRHVHLSEADVARLFGVGYRLTKLRDLVQPGQYACQETVVLEAEKGKTTLRVVGPVRKETQIELSYTDCFKLGIRPVLRMSGGIAGTPGGTLLSGERRITIPHGIMVAQRHLHMSPEEAVAYGLQNGDTVTLRIEGERAAQLNGLAVRTGVEHRLEAHIDKDEANACGIQDGQLCRIIAEGKSQAQAARQTVRMPQARAATEPSAAQGLHTYIPQRASSLIPPVGSAARIETKTKLLDLSGDPKCLMTEDSVLSAFHSGVKVIRYRKGAVITPLAREVASAKGVELIELT